MTDNIETTLRNSSNKSSYIYNFASIPEEKGLMDVLRQIYGNNPDITISREDYHQNRSLEELAEDRNYKREPTIWDPIVVKERKASWYTPLTGNRLGVTYNILARTDIDVDPQRENPHIMRFGNEEDRIRFANSYENPGHEEISVEIKPEQKGTDLYSKVAFIASSDKRTKELSRDYELLMNFSNKLMSDEPGRRYQPEEIITGLLAESNNGPDQNTKYAA